MSPGCVSGVFGALNLGNSSRSGLSQALVIVVAFISVTLLAFIWAAFFRRSAVRRRYLTLILNRCVDRSPKIATHIGRIG